MEENEEEKYIQRQFSIKAPNQEELKGKAYEEEKVDLQLGILY